MRNAIVYMQRPCFDRKILKTPHKYSTVTRHPTQVWTWYSISFQFYLIPIFANFNDKPLAAIVFLSALKSHGKSATFRQHYYPEGGWGWVVTFCSFLANIFTTGLQLSYGVLLLEVTKHFSDEATKLNIRKFESLILQAVLSFPVSA